MHSLQTDFAISFPIFCADDGRYYMHLCGYGFISRLKLIRGGGYRDLLYQLFQLIDLLQRRFGAQLIRLHVAHRRHQRIKGSRLELLFHKSVFDIHCPVQHAHDAKSFCVLLKEDHIIPISKGTYVVS